jgi:hypothetical protein
MAENDRGTRTDQSSDVNVNVNVNECRRQPRHEDVSTGTGTEYANSLK